MKIFISYRRADSKYVVDRIRDRLIATFGPDQVFRDIEGIPLGMDFSAVLESEIQGCTVMLVVIGRQWLGITDGQGNKRLFDPNDYTRIEVEAGLRREGILVIPVLVMGMKMKDLPAARDLPESLSSLALRNGLEVREDPDFNHDMQRLITSIDQSQGGAVIVQDTDARIDIRHQEATPSEIRRQAETADLVHLKHTVSIKLENLNKHLSSSLEKGRNPYRFGQALKFRESELLAGRETVVGNLLEILKTDHTAFVAGNGGSGKTSLLQAGLMPHIVRQGDLPVVISISSGSLETSIKREFLGEVTQTLYLSQVPLSTFLRHVTECLPQTKHVHILLDNFEDFLNRPEEEIEAFKQEWIHCTSNIPRIHWLFCIHLGVSHLLNFFRPEINPFTDLVVLAPLDREAARQAIVRPASICGFKMEDSVIENILDRLGRSNIDPGQLQTVCYLMAGGNGPVRLNWTMNDYERSGRADGILSQSLESLIDQLKYGDRGTAWRILASLAEETNEAKTLNGLTRQLKSYGIQPESVERTLELLEEIHLVDLEDDHYRLANQSMRPRIQQWVNEQTALVQARQEAMNQLRQLRNSALRGLLGGAVGFILFDQIVYTGAVPDLSFVVFFLTSVASIGGISGFLLTLTVDLSIAAYRGSRAWMRYLVGGTGGMVAYALGLLLYINNNYAGDTLLQILPATALEGGLWGAVIGLGTTYALGSRRQVWLITLATAFASGLTLLGAEYILSVLVNEAWAEAPSPMQILIAGALMPLCYITAALFRRPADEKWN